MKSGQRRKSFTPTPAQDQRRNALLVVFNQRFPTVRHRIYTGAIWAGVLIPSTVDSYYQEELTKIAQRLPSYRAAGTASILTSDYQGLYHNAAESQLTAAELAELETEA